MARTRSVRTERALAVIDNPAFAQGALPQASSIDWIAAADDAWFRLEPAPTYEAIKRALDVILAAFALLMLLPLFAVIAVAIKLDSPGPVFFRQERFGKGLRSFAMLKFRSMYTHDVELPPDLMLLNESSGPLFKMRRDPRITRVGRVLRRLSFDELPQFINVLVGEMSLVGPRPPLAREIDGYVGVQKLRLRVLPGVTGLWQVSGRSDLAFDDMIRLDLRYIDERSIKGDLAILLKTVPCVIAGRGAY